MTEVIEEKLFDKSCDAWDYMVSSQARDENHIYSIPSKNSCLVEKSKRKFMGELKYLPDGYKAPMLDSDNMGTLHGVKSMADGKYYDSKSEYRKSLKQQGYIEMGNDAPREVKRETQGDFITKQQIADIMNR